MTTKQNKNKENHKINKNQKQRKILKAAKEIILSSKE